MGQYSYFLHEKKQGTRRGPCHLTRGKMPRLYVPYLRRLRPLAVAHPHNVARIAQHLVDQAIFLGLDGIHVAVALEVLLDLLPRAASVLADQVEELGLHALLLTESDAHIFGIALRAAAGRVQV